MLRFISLAGLALREGSFRSQVTDSLVTNITIFLILFGLMSAIISVYFDAKNYGFEDRIFEQRSEKLVYNKNEKFLSQSVNHY